MRSHTQTSNIIYADLPSSNTYYHSKFTEVCDLVTLNSNFLYFFHIFRPFYVVLRSFLIRFLHIYSRNFTICTFLVKLIELRRAYFCSKKKKNTSKDVLLLQNKPVANATGLLPNVGLSLELMTTHNIGHTKFLLPLIAHNFSQFINILNYYRPSLQFNYSFKCHHL